MQATLEQLLCLARADAGVPGRDVEVELLGICREVIDEVRAEHPGAPPVTVEGDAVFLRCDPVSFGMIVRNLIENAVRHTPTDGSVDVHLRTGADGVHLQVRDTGEGIPAASLPHVFERFHQADPSRTGASAGLGLSIVQTLVRARGGTVRIDSIHGAGTTVSLTLPSR